MNILALDLGTKTGWARRDSNGGFESGTWILSTPAATKSLKKQGISDGRFRVLKAMIEQQGRMNAIYYEDVQFASSQYQAQLWGGFRAIVTLFQDHNCHIVGVPVGTLKKFATGRGNAKKPDMALALLRSSQGFYEAAPSSLVQRKTNPLFVVDRSTQRPIDDNEIDAIHLLKFAWKQWE